MREGGSETALIPAPLLRPATTRPNTAAAIEEPACLSLAASDYYNCSAATPIERAACCICPGVKGSPSSSVIHSFAPGARARSFDRPASAILSTSFRQPCANPAAVGGSMARLHVRGKGGRRAQQRPRAQPIEPAN